MKFYLIRIASCAFILGVIWGLYRFYYLNDEFSIKVFDLKEDAEEFVKKQIVENKNNVADQTKKLTNIIENALEKGSVDSMFRKSSEEYNSFWKRNLEKYVKVKV